VDTRPTEEQRALADAADRLAAKLGPGAVGDLDDHDRRDRLEAALVQSGWRDLRSGTPSEPMASGVEAAFVTRALARRSCDTAFLGPVLAGDLLRRAGLDPAALDDTSPTIAVTPDLRRLARWSDGWSSVPLAIDTAGSAAALLIRHGDQGSFVASANVLEAVGGVDLTRAVAPTDGATTVIHGGSPLTDDDLLAWEALAVTLTAADLVGAIDGAVDLAVEYARERRQYGAAIGSFQAVQHMLAESATLKEGAISALDYASWAVDALPAADARQAAAVAKAYASRAARFACETSIQVHGGIGNTWECMAHVFLRRSLLATALFGGDGPQLAYIAQQRLGGTHGLS
jgi:hypothetical protein